MTPLIDMLSDAIPAWATVAPLDAARLRADVAPPWLSGAPGDRFDLVIDTDSPEAIVSEAIVGTRLPATCPERHINSDGTFCLGLRRGAITSAEEARGFWETLRGYLLAQQFAERNSRWPAGRGLSHGYDAADSQIAAEQAAVRCGLAAAYAAALDHGVGWLAGPLPDIFDIDGCDHGATPTPDEANRLAVSADCPTCAAIAEVVRHERARRAADARFVELARYLRPCCGTMPRCPLRRAPIGVGGQ